MGYDHRTTNRNYYPQPKISDAYRDIKTRITPGQYEGLQTLRYEMGLSMSEIHRRAINIILNNKLLLLQGEAAITPILEDIGPKSIIENARDRHDYPEWDCNCDPPVLGRQDLCCEICGTLYNGKVLQTKLEDYAHLRGK